MIIMIIYSVLSFLLDGLLSNYMNVGIINPSYFRTIFTIISLVIIHNYFDEHKKYLYILITLGILFDIIYTNTFMLNTFIFIIIYLILNQLNYFIPNNLFTINIKSLLAIIIYHILSFLILMIANYHYYSSKLLLNIITHSIISTIIYTSISYIIIKKTYFKFYNKKIK